MKPAPAAVASPCINICQMHAASGWCVGCLRTLDEIAAWGSLSDAGRRQVLDGLAPRRKVWRAIRQAARAATAAGADVAASNGNATGSAPDGERTDVHRRDTP